MFVWGLHEALTGCTSPMKYCFSISLASVECPTSSKLSVASLPACSSSTSSPPGCWKRRVQVSQGWMQKGTEGVISLPPSLHCWISQPTPSMKSARGSIVQPPLRNSQTPGGKDTLLLQVLQNCCLADSAHGCAILNLIMCATTSDTGGGNHEVSQK